MTHQTLPFTVTIATTQDDLLEACEVRSEGYGHHLPTLKGDYAKPEPLDTAIGTVVLVARDKASGRAIGTARVQTTTNGADLLIESCVELTESILTQGRAEITKLAASTTADPLVKIAIWKAAYLFCLASQARHLLIGARSRGLVRQYKRLGALPFHADERMIPLPYAANIPHQVLVFDVISAERNWFVNSHALANFMFHTCHSDITIVPSPRITANHRTDQQRFGQSAAA